jgi:hypothetical protein
MAMARRDDSTVMLSRSEASRHPTRQSLRGVYPERQRRAQGDTHLLLMSLSHLILITNSHSAAFNGCAKKYDASYSIKKRKISNICEWINYILLLWLHEGDPGVSIVIDRGYLGEEKMPGEVANNEEQHEHNQPD